MICYPCKTLISVTRYYLGWLLELQITSILLEPTLETLWTSVCVAYSCSSRAVEVSIKALQERTNTVFVWASSSSFRTKTIKSSSKREELKKGYCKGLFIFHISFSSCLFIADFTRNASLKHTSKNAKKKLRIHQVFSFIFLAEKYSYNL